MTGELINNFEPEIESITLEVESLEEAKAFLSGAGLLGKQTDAAVEVDPAKAFGLRMILRPWIVQMER